MKTLLSIVIIACIFAACKPKGPSEYYWFSVRENRRTDSVKLISSNIDKVADTIKLDYAFDWGSIDYMIAPNKSGTVVLHPKKKTGSGVDSIKPMIHLNDTTVKLGSNAYDVTRYVISDSTGQVTHCYTPDLGMYAFFNERRQGIVFLQSNDTAFNSRVKGLIRATVPIILGTARVDAY